MNRRYFVKSAIAVAATTSLQMISLTAAGSAKPRWPIGCMNRPWGKWNFDVALDGIKSAGYPLVGLLMRSKEEPLIGSEATPEYLQKLKERISSRRLKANMASLRSRHDIPVEESIRDLRKQIDHAHILGLETVMTFGVDKPADYEHFYKVMADAAAYAAERKVQVVLKPHGGGSGAAEEILRCLEKVKHPNFRIWYDAGNIIHYTGKDPVEELKPIAQHVTGFCAKDCAQQKGDVMIQFGAGKVDFVSVFKTLKKAGFNGPVMVECAAPAETADQETANAKANREFLEKVFAAI